MKKTTLTPPPKVNVRIKMSADAEYADKIMGLPSEKKVHRSLFYALGSAACVMLVAACVFVLALYRPFAPADKDEVVKPDPRPWYNLPVGDELFETIDYDPYAELVNANYGLPFSEAELFDWADVVVIGFAENTFTDELAGYFNNKYQQVEDFNDAILARTMRPIKVVECLKGDFKEKDTLTLAARGYCVRDEGGNLDIVDEGGGRFIQKQNVKYIFYLRKFGTDINGNPVYDTVMLVGCNNIDGLDADSYGQNDLVHDILPTYFDKFEKYDRRDEYPRRHTHRNAYLMAIEKYYPYGYLNYCCEAQAYDDADAVAVVSASGDIRTDEIISLNPEKSADAPDGSSDFKALQSLTVLESLKGELGKNIRLMSDSYWYYSPNTLGYQFNSVPRWELGHIEQGDVYILYLKRMPEYGEDVYKQTTVISRVWVNADREWSHCNDADVYMRYPDVFKKHR